MKVTKIIKTVSEMIQPAHYIANNCPGFAGGVKVEVIKEGFFNTCTLRISAHTEYQLNRFTSALGLTP